MENIMYKAIKRKIAGLLACAALLCVFSGCTVVQDASLGGSGLETTDVSDDGFILVYSNEKENLFFTEKPARM